MLKNKLQKLDFKQIAMILLVALVLLACTNLPKEIDHIPQEPNTNMASKLSSLVERNMTQQMAPGKSAVLLQETGWEALAQRLALVEQAEHFVDIQYYIWNSDISGLYLASRLIAAADRGVRVRVMLDDINLNERESLLAALDQHANIEIRIFNPIPSRRGLGKWFSFLGDFSRFNRRMHNKMFTVDGVFSILGGRNIGDEYFDLSTELNFRDRDVLVAGAVVADIQHSFERYWSSRWSYPIGLLTEDHSFDLTDIEAVKLPNYRQPAVLPTSKKNAEHYLKQILDQMHWVRARFISDNPVPENPDDTSQPKTTARLIADVAKQANREILIESAYLILDDDQLLKWRDLTSRGVAIKSLTNSMASNDLISNHSGYARRRLEMIESGMQIFELKPNAKLCLEADPETGVSAICGLHSKSVVFDRSISIIGSFNLNLRSTYLNTELLLVIEDKSFSEYLADTMEQSMQADNSWQLSFENSQLYWSDGKDKWTTEPETQRWQRVKSRFLQLFPIEKYL